MARSKSLLFGFEEQLIANFSHALSHPARVVILRKLISRKVCSYLELIAEVPLAESTIEQHFRLLERTGLMVKAMNGKETGYSLDREVYLLSLAAMREQFRTDRVKHRRVLIIEDEVGPLVLP
ncbi:ArsR/SmtB family transcription factor [Neolewinella persica]|uniref:ArsR/SmtB family transcription factor n=1 Tax=Neolewinella persica TaxID=70998 RepID=UPI00036883AD|nr:winged helix-turn-helix domain-containing protein [Neolewinella persica]